MGMNGDRSFDWVAGLALVFGAAVTVASLAALAVTLIAVVAAVFIALSFIALPRSGHRTTCPLDLNIRLFLGLYRKAASLASEPMSVSNVLRLGHPR